MIALARHFYTFASRLTAGVAAKFLPNWHSAKTGYVGAHPDFFIRYSGLRFWQSHAFSPITKHCHL
jgi:hypothetical protein